ALPLLARGVQLPMARRVLVGRVEDGLFEEWIGRAHCASLPRLGSPHLWSQHPPRGTCPYDRTELTNPAADATTLDGPRLELSHAQTCRAMRNSAMHVDEISRNLLPTSPSLKPELRLGTGIGLWIVESSRRNAADDKNPENSTKAWRRRQTCGECIARSES